MRLARGAVATRVSGWLGGVKENAPPLAFEDGEIASVDSAQNFFLTPAGKVAVRGGAATKATLTSANRVTLVREFTPVGAVAIALSDGSTKHYIWRLTTDMAFYTGVEATSKHDLAWNVATPCRPSSAELFEKLYIADANVDYAQRQVLKVVDSAGTINSVSQDLGGGAENLKPYCCEEYNSHLFIAGYDNKTASADAPHLIRHSLLGTAPDAGGGFDSTAYLICGAKGQRVTAMRKGRGILLVAKANELFRITGFGRSIPGWQFTIEQVTNALGMGCSNPMALAFDGRHWFGVGEAGPFRTDGFDVESLVGFRRRSWNKIANHSLAWVAYHPDRDCVLFGLNESPPVTGRSATYPNVVWVWDCKREVWAGDLRCSADLYVGAAIPTNTILGPTAPPSGLTIDHASAGSTSVAASWTNGDATASTEVWVRFGTSGYVLYSVQNPGVASATISLPTPATQYYMKLRHSKNSIVTDYSSEVAAYTLLYPPGVTSPSQTKSSITLRTYISYHSQGEIRLEKSGVEIEVIPVTAIGNYDALDSGLTCGTSYGPYRARLYDSSWPAAIQYSAYSGTLTQSTLDCAGSGPDQ